MSGTHKSTCTDTFTTGIGSYLCLEKQQINSKVLRVRDQAEKQGVSIWTYVLSKEQVETQIQALPKDANLDTHPLLGVPYAVKDNIDVKNVPTTAGCTAYCYTPSQDAVVVGRLREAGAIVIGKTGLDQFATGLVGTRIPSDLGGPVPNSLSFITGPPRVCGGSSAGSAASVASRIVPFSLGTDTAGSGRVPAAFNNIVGIKPTPKRVSIQGVVPACRSLDCVSVFALSAEDAAVVLAIIEDNYSSVSGNGHRNGPSKFDYNSLRVAVPDILPSYTDEQYAQTFEKIKETLKSNVNCVNSISFKLLYEVAALLYEGPWIAERHTVIGHLLESNPKALDPIVSHVVKKAESISATDTFVAMYKLEDLAKAIKVDIWKKVDLLMVPTTPCHPTYQDVEEKPVEVNSQLGTWTNFVNLLGLSAIAIPAAILPNGCPFGVTFIAPGYFDAALAELGAFCQRKLFPLNFVGNKIDLPSSASSLKPHSEPVMKLAVVGAHLHGMPLHYQLIEREAKLIQKVKSAKAYRLYALAGSNPPKPGLIRVGSDDPSAASIELEVYSIPEIHIGSFLALIPPPLGLGSIQIENDDWVKGFICQSVDLHKASDISGFGGWRAYMDSKRAA